MRTVNLIDMLQRCPICERAELPWDMEEHIQRAHPLPGRPWWLRWAKRIARLL